LHSTTHVSLQLHYNNAFLFLTVRRVFFRVRTVIEKLEKSGHYIMVISRPGKVLLKKIPKVLEKA